MKLFALLLFLLVCNEAVLITAAMPNILMFVIDDLGWNDTSYKGSGVITPSIDKLANQGIRLQQYYVQRLYSPSRAALMAGRYPYNMGPRPQLNL